MLGGDFETYLWASQKQIPITYNNLGNAYADINKKEETIAGYKKAIELDPDYAAAHNNLAVLYYEKKQYDLAIHHFNRVIELGFGHRIDPGFLEILNPTGNRRKC